MILQRRNFSFLSRTGNAVKNAFRSKESILEDDFKKMMGGDFSGEPERDIKDRNIARGVMGVTALAGLGYGAKKLYDRHKKKKKEREEKESK